LFTAQWKLATVMWQPDKLGRHWNAILDWNIQVLYGEKNPNASDQPASPDCAYKSSIF
jgi:hypothetical protein